MLFGKCVKKLCSIYCILLCVLFMSYYSRMAQKPMRRADIIIQNSKKITQTDIHTSNHQSARRSTRRRYACRRLLFDLVFIVNIFWLHWMAMKIRQCYVLALMAAHCSRDPLMLVRVLPWTDVRHHIISFSKMFIHIPRLTQATG